MRVGFFILLLAGLPTATLLAQTAPAPGGGAPQLPPAMQRLLATLKTLPVESGPPKPTSLLDASFFLPKNLIANAATALAKETRTPAQLEALLAAYVGTWRGESLWYSTSSQRSMRAPTEVVYKMEKENNRNILTCVITYQFNNTRSYAFSRLWVENGHIFSEVAQGGVRQKYVAQTREGGLAWSPYGSLETLLDFGESETLRLSVDGGQISSKGFEVQHTNQGSSLVLEATELKLVK